MKRVLLLWAVVGVACGGEPPVIAKDADEEYESAGLPLAAELPPMPAFPNAQPGYLTAVSAGPHVITGAWKAGTGSCEEPAILQVLAEVPGTGTIIVLVLDEEQRVGLYPIAMVDEDLPVAPAARVGVQVLLDDDSYTLQAVDGQVEVYGYGANVSGRFAVTLRETRTAQRIQYAGVFDSIPITPLADEYCERLRAVTAPGPAAVR